MYHLDLFCGTKSFGKVFAKNGYQSYSVDILAKYNPTYCGDILYWDYTSLGFVPDVITASPPCNSWGKYASNNNKTRDFKTLLALKPVAILGEILVLRTLQIFDYFRQINCNVVFIMENPRWLLRRYPPLLQRVESGELIEHDTLYSLYGFPTPKPTNFWSNIRLYIRFNGVPDTDEEKMTMSYYYSPKENRCRFEKLKSHQKIMIPGDLVVDIYRSVQSHFIEAETDCFL